MTSKLRKAVQQQKKQTKKPEKPITGSLGIPINGQKRVEVPGRNGFVYVRLRNNENEVIQAFNNQVSPAYNLPVLVARQGTRYVVTSVDTQRYNNNWDSYSAFVPRHGGQHSFDVESGGGGDIVWVHGRQFMPLLTIPSGSVGANNVLLTSYTLRNQDGSWKFVGNTGTQNLSPYNPTTGSQAVMGIVYLDTVSGNPGFILNSGTYFPNTITGSAQIVPYLPTITNPNWIPDSAIRLITGTSKITWDNIYDVRQYYGSISTGTGGAGTALNVQDEGTPLGTANTLNFVGDNVGVSVSGTVARVYVTGSNSGINTGTLNSLYLRLDATNDPVTGRLRVITTGIFTSLFVENDSGNNVFGAEQYTDGNTTQPTAYFYRTTNNAGDTLFGPMILGQEDVAPGNISGSFIQYLRDSVEQFSVNTSGTVLSNGIPLIKEAPVDGNIYGRKNAGWELITGSSSSMSSFDNFWTSGSAGAYSIRAKNNSTTDAVGDYSFARGINSYASGTISTAEGFGTIATGDQSHAEGSNTSAIGTQSHAEGSSTIAAGDQSHAEGVFTKAYGQTAHAEGLSTVASGTYSFAGGNANHALGIASAALGGRNNRVLGNNSVVLGGSGTVGVADDTVFVPKLNIRNIQTGTPLFNLGADTNGNVVIGTTGTTSVQSNDGWNTDGNTWTFLSADAPSYVVSVNANVTGTIGVGMKTQLTHQSINKNFIVTAIGVTGSTSYLNLYGGTDYTLNVTGTITNPKYSQAKAPFGFPLNPDKWTVSFSDTIERSQSSPTANTWYNLGSLSLSVPIGAWQIKYKRSSFASRASASAINILSTLSTANNTESNPSFTDIWSDGSATSVQGFATSIVNIITTSKTTYYINSSTTKTGLSAIYLLNSGSALTVDCLCAYL